MSFSYSLTCVRSSMLADFLMASAICRHKWRACSSCGRSGFIAASLIDGGFECYGLISTVISSKGVPTVRFSDMLFNNAHPISQSDSGLHRQDASFSIT
jgi:hypothetical protein